MKKTLLASLATGLFIVGAVGIANAATITNGFTFAVASGSDQSTGSHYHSNTGGAFGNPAGLAEVGNYGYEEVRGLSEYNLTGLPAAIDAFFTFKVYGTGLFVGVNNFPFTGIVDIFAYQGNNTEDISDYQAVNTGAIGSFSTAGLNVGDVYSFNIKNIFNTAVGNDWTSLGIRLQTENTVNNGGAWVFNDFKLTNTDDSTNAVPEPATMLLFGTGIAGLAAVGRRKRS